MEAVAAVGTIAALINDVSELAMGLKRIYDQMKGAEAMLLSVAAQLNTIKAALVQIDELLQTAQYGQHLQEDLDLALQALQLQIDSISAKMSIYKMNKAGTGLKFGSKVKVVLESEDISGSLLGLNHQATALNLLITVLTSKSLTEQKNLLQRSNSRKIFTQIQEDKASLLEETSFVPALPDRSSASKPFLRSTSPPLIASDTRQAFSFDSQVLRSKAYNKLFRRRASDRDATSVGASETRAETDTETCLDDTTTLVAKSELSIGNIKPKLDMDLTKDTVAKPPRFSSILAFANTQIEITAIVNAGRHVWNTQDAEDSSQIASPFKRPFHMHRLTTSYFDVSISSYTLDNLEQERLREELLDRHRGVSSVLFVVQLSSYQDAEHKYHRDSSLFGKVANDYHLLLAKIILFLDTTNLDPYKATSLSGEVEQGFRQTGRLGLNEDRIRVVVGKSDEMAAGTIFAICNESERLAENKWAGLTKSPTY